MSITPVLDEVGEVKYYTVLMQDITARKAREEELRERNAELEASLRYAARLQRAFMPKNLDGLRAYFKDVGLWYQPLRRLVATFMATSRGKWRSIRHWGCYGPRRPRRSHQHLCPYKPL